MMDHITEWEGRTDTGRGSVKVLHTLRVSVGRIAAVFRQRDTKRSVYQTK